MVQTMRAVRKAGQERGLVVEDVPVPQIGPGEVLVAVEAASVCGTDLHIWHWNEWSRQRLKPPLTIGQEFAGTVVETGRSVEHVKVGDYVSAESHVTCGMCFQCRTGQAHMCPNTRILGVDRDGAFADYIALPEKVIWQNDRRKMPAEIATLQESFGNAVFATLAHDLAGQSVGVMGCGPVGLYSIGIAKASGAARGMATDLSEFRLDLARSMGADHVFNPSRSDADVADWLVESNEGFGIDVMLEMSGAPQAIDATFRDVRNGGRVTLFGIPDSPVRIDVAESMIFKNLTVLALNGRRIFDTWYRTRWLLENGVVDLRPLITQELDLEDIDEATRMLEAGEACKIILRPRAGGEVSRSQEGESREPDANIQGQDLHR